MTDLPLLVNQKIETHLGWNVESLAAPVKDDDYGYEWPEGTMQYIKELWGYLVGSTGHSKFWHMINAIKLDLPHVELHKNGYINTTFLDVINELCENADLGIAGAASTGKTFPAACFYVEDWKAAPNRTLTFVCTTSLGASEDRIWGAITGLHRRSVYKIGEHISHKYVIAWDSFSDDASDREYNAAIKALGIKPGKEGAAAIDTTRGRKQSRVRVVFDELPEMGKYSLKALVNLEANPDLRATYLGNPNRTDDAHGDALKPDHPQGYKSINKDTRQWKTRTGKAIFIRGDWSPNFQAPPEEPIPFPYLTNRHTLERMLIRCHGDTNSLEYWRNAVGFWADSSISNTILTEELIEANFGYQNFSWSANHPVIRLCGFDIGLTHGGDSCVATMAELGIAAISNRKLLQYRKTKEFFPPAEGVFEDQLAVMFVDWAIEQKLKPAHIGMDIGGDGGKVYRSIVREWIKRGQLDAADIVAISSMGRPTDRIVSNIDPRLCSDAFDRLVSEYWGMVREGVATQCLCNLPRDSKTVSQLCTRTYEILNRKLCIETKLEMKERTNGESPDFGDSYVYTVEMARRFGLNFVSIVDFDRRREETKRELVHALAGEDDEYGSDSWGED